MLPALLGVQPPLRAAFSLSSSVTSTKEGNLSHLAGGMVYRCFSPCRKPQSEDTPFPGVCSQNSQHAGPPRTSLLLYFDFLRSA